MTSSTGILTIDLAAIQANWRLVRGRLRSGASCAAVVKANAYGVGALEVARALYRADCRHFFVVTLEEGLQLRAHLPVDAMLYVLGGARAGTEAKFADADLIPVLYSPHAVSRWLGFCESLQRPLPCVIKIDSGMTRLGLGADEFEEFIHSCGEYRFLNPVVFMSHLACADDPSHPLNQSQLVYFTQSFQRIKAIYPAIKASLANSSGTFLGAAYHFDMVRIGAALYGINPQSCEPNPLRASIQLKLPIQQIRNIHTVAGVGYGAEATVEPGMRLAVVAGGYADGIHRTLGAVPKGQIDGIEVRAIGRLSMDSCVFDISAASVAMPQYIEVINDQLTLDRLMESNNTLGYEVLTSLGRRYTRVYLSENGALDD